jgi:hypothetical protein
MSNGTLTPGVKAAEEGGKPHISALGQQLKLRAESSPFSIDVLCRCRKNSTFTLTVFTTRMPSYMHLLRICAAAVSFITVFC